MRVGQKLLDLRVLPALFFFSGASSLVFEAIFTRLLTYTFGNTAHAVSTVLAAFLGGLGLGAYLLGRWADRRVPSLMVYGLLELLIGGYCFFVLPLLKLLTAGYVAIDHRFGFGEAGLTLLRFALGASVMIVPATLMGGTLPVLARYLADCSRDFEPELARLYGWNTLGAALGTLAATYWLMPDLGVRATIGVACVINVSIFLLTIILPAPPRLEASAESLPPADRGDAPEASPARSLSRLIVAAFFTGAVALAYEVIWTHILSFLIGNTVYAFGVMLFTFLAGLGWGAHIVARNLRRVELWGGALALSQLLLGIVTFLSVALWRLVPELFARGVPAAIQMDFVGLAVPLVARMIWVGWGLYRSVAAGGVAWGRLTEIVAEGVILGAFAKLEPSAVLRSGAYSFAVVELLRFLATAYLLIVPALLLGMSFPLLLNLSSHKTRRVGGSTGGVYAANAVGSVLGSLAAGFGVLPRFGSLAALRSVATLNLVLGWCFGLLWFPASAARKLALALAIIALAVVFWTGRWGWDAGWMARGSYIYLDAGTQFDRVLYAEEDVAGGLTSVVSIGSSRVLLSNGKFQGSDSLEVPAQIRLALAPILFTRDFDRALVIGLGTGNTLRTVALFPFREIDVAEIAPHIVEAARLWFEQVNGGVIDRDPRVHLSIADGRNFLLLTRHRFDLITIEVTSIWISGEADLYNREFYELCRARLTEHGVLQQWVQIHHIRAADLLVILNTAARVFPHVAFFLGPEHGLLIASGSPLECDYRQLAAFDSEPAVRRDLAAANLPSLFAALSELALDDDALRRAVDEMPRLSGLPRNFASTDFRPYLEYQTPKGNVLTYAAFQENLQFLQRFRPPVIPPAVPIRNLPSENERNLVYGYIAEAIGSRDLAVRYFRAVGGPARDRAMAEIRRLEDANPY